MLQENGKPVFYSLKDPELYAKYPAAIVKYLEFLAKVRGQELSQLQEEIVVMDRSREAALLNELRKLQQVIPGLKIVGKDQKGIADGTVAHGLKASMSKEMYEQTTGQPYGLHKTLITIGGSAEGFMNLAVVGELKSTGAVGALRIYSANMNNDAQGQVMNDQSQRYAFTEEEKKDIKDLRTSYGDAEEILQGKKLFTEQDVKGEVSGTFSFISTNGVFHQEGNRNLSDVGSVSQVLQISKVNGKPKSEIISDVVKLEQAQPELTAVAVASDEPSGVEIGEAISQAVKSEEVQGPALTGRTLYDALKASPSGQKAVTMCTNIRTPLSLDGIMQAAKETGSIAIFQQAISEFGYTWPQGYSPENTYQFAEEVKVAAQRNEFSNYVLKADHITFNISDKELMKEFLADKSAQNEIIALLDAILSAKSNSEREAIFNKALDSKAFMSDKKISAALKALKKAVEHVKSAVGASFTIYALDASFMPMPINARATAFMAGFIPGNSSIEAEVGEIGGTRNSTIADALELITGIRYKEVIKEEPVPNDPKKTIQYSELVKDSQGNPIEEYKGKGLLDYGVKPDRIAINNGTAHGNVFDKDGNPVQTQMNLKATAAIAAALVPYGINIVQHGVTGTPLESLPALRAAGITEAHVGTQWQNIFWEELNTLAETDSKVRDLVNRMLNTLIERYGKKYDITPGKIAAAFRLLLKGKPAEEKKFEEMIGKELKNILGNYQEEFDVLPADVKARIAAATKRSALEHFKAFGTVGVGQAVAKQSLRAKRDNYPLRVTSQTAAELTAMGLRGAYQKVLDIVNLTKNPQQQSRELIVVFEQLSQATGQHQKITAILPLLTSRDSSQPLTKEELKKINAAIKDAADGVAKQIFERTAKEQGIILMVRVSEGFGRDAVAESLKANEVIVPDEIRGEIREIQTAIEAGEEFYSSKTTTKAYPIADVIVDVVEGTNQFVTNSGNKTLKDIPAYEAGATSVMVLSYGRQGGVRALGNAPDGYVGQFIANLGQHAEEFNQEKILLQENGKPVFYSLKDPELYAKYPAAIVKYLEFLAKVRGQE
ncbi:MAG: class II fructose-bisphosphate aldolase, partial [Candidatus Omnitrophica bacterium]|nr:class II fructose-bisphosphate aldolase [Candidatus Omnitrophota bacterium]